MSSARAVAALAALLAALLAVGCSPSREVAIVGDSITVLITDQLDTESDTTWDVRAVIGATAEQMRPGADELAATRHDQAAVNLGTNDALTGVPRDTTVANLQAIVDGFDGSDCIHLVTISTRLPTADQPDAQQSAAAINDWIRSTAESDDAVRIVDWDAEVTGPDGASLLQDDGIHPNEQGRTRLVEMLDSSVADCKLLG